MLSSRRLPAILVLLAACDRGGASHPTPSAPTASPPSGASAQPLAAAPLAEGSTPRGTLATVSCKQDAAFPGSWDLPEASAAAEVELTRGVREMLVVSDSGHDGQSLAWRIPNGPLRPLKLPLDPGASDDIEGAAWRGAHLYTLTSSGAVRRFSPDGKGALVRDQDAYALGAPPASCPKLTDGNCGRNYEGLCLRGPSASSRCVGYAASKATSTLYCLVLAADRLVVDPIKPPLKLSLPKNNLSDCAFGSEHGPAEAVLLVTTNLYGGSATYQVDEGDGSLRALDVPGTLSNEAVAVDRDGSLYQFMDDNHAESAALRMTCSAW